MSNWLNTLLKKLKIQRFHSKFDYGEYISEKRRTNLHQILNTALSLSMEFGPNLNKPINSRLKKAFPYLSRKERFAYNKLSYEITLKGREYMFDHYYNMKTEEDFDLIKIKFANNLRLYNNWISDENINELFKQACYYASK